MKKLDKHIKNIIKNERLIIIFFAVFYFIFSYALVYTSVTPPKFDLKAGDVATQDIKAPKDVVDIIATQKKIQEAVNAVNPNNGGMYKSIGYLIIEPPIPTIPEIKEPTNPIKKSVSINAKSILFPP